jgi:hypothetical protein
VRLCMQTAYSLAVPAAVAAMHVGERNAPNDHVCGVCGCMVSEVFAALAGTLSVHTCKLEAALSTSHVGRMLWPADFTAARCCCWAPGLTRYL